MNLVITTTTNLVKVDFNDTPFNDLSGYTFSKGTWQKDVVQNIKLSTDRVEVEVQAENGHGSHWHLAIASTNGCFIVDSIDGVAPSSLSDLYTKLVAML